MSSVPTGKYQDHYQVLGVETKADSETIQNAYTELARRYHPSSGTTPDADRFKAATSAFEVLLDPSARQAFDSLRGGSEPELGHRFRGAEFFRDLAIEPDRRMAMLALLYDRARSNPSRPGLSLRITENLMTLGSDDLRFTIYFLKQKGLISSDDKSNVQITVDGMEYLEKANPDPARIAEFLAKDKSGVETPATPKEDAPAPAVAGNAPISVAAAPAAASAASLPATGLNRPRIVVPPRVPRPS